MTAERPNFLFIITDQHRWDHLGLAGHRLLRTPNIDSIGRQGSWLPRFMVATPICMSNRATFLTGRMSTLHGVRHNGIPMDPDLVCFTDVMRAAGYHTGLVGKIHLQPMDADPPAYEPDPPIPGHLPPPFEFGEARRRPAPFPALTENRKSWRENPDRDIDLPYYGFEEVSLVCGHGDLCTGHYEKWLRMAAPDIAHRRGPDHALERSKVGAPQVYKPYLPEELYPTRFIQEMTEGFLDRAAASGTPFFLQVGFPDPHHPFTPPGRYYSTYSPDEVDLPETFHKSRHDQIPPLQVLWQSHRGAIRDKRWTMPMAVEEDEARDILAKTYGQIAMLDDAIGAILKRLAATGLDKNTVVVFTSDHGDWMGDHGLMLKGPLHYQGLLRCPFLWKDPDPRYNNGRIESMGGYIDLARTLLARAGLAPPNGVQGRNLLPVLAGEEELADRAILVEQSTQYAELGFDRIVRLSTLVERDWRMTVWEGCPWGELYDLRNDPGELRNLWDEPAAAEDKARLMLRLVHEMQAHQDRSPHPIARG